MRNNTEDNFLLELFMIGADDATFEPKTLYTHVLKEVTSCERRKCVKYFCFPDNVPLIPLNDETELIEVLAEWEAGTNRGHFVFTLNSDDKSVANCDTSGVSIFSKEDMSGLNCVCLRFVDLIGDFDDENDVMSNTFYASERVLCLMTADNQYAVHIAMLE